MSMAMEALQQLLIWFITPKMSLHKMQIQLLLSHSATMKVQPISDGELTLQFYGSMRTSLLHLTSDSLMITGKTVGYSSTSLKQTTLTFLVRILIKEAMDSMK